MADRFPEIAANNKKGHTVEDVALMKVDETRIQTDVVCAPFNDFSFNSRNVAAVIFAEH
jgi:hypothetical protein